jgi:hypothetical protein
LILILAQVNECRVPKLLVRCPLGEIDFSEKLQAQNTAPTMQAQD